MRQTVQYRILGMDCAEEVSLLRRELSTHRGLHDLRFDILQARMTAEFEDTMTSSAALLQAVARTGLRGEPWTDAPTAPQAAWATHGRSVMASLSGAALLVALLLHGLDTGSLLLAFFAHGDDEHAISLPARLFFLLAIGTGVWYSAPKALRALRDRRADMNVLMAISIAGALSLGEWSEAATVAFLFSVANLLEGWSMAKARNAIGALLRVTPTEASVRHGDHEHRVPVARLSVGSVILVRPGERIPCDGEIVAGRTSVDQALLTGESVPALKGAGDSVYAGTINGGGAIEVRTTRPASDTTLARILRMVEESQHRRAPVEQWVERFARYYTPAMIVLALLVAALPPLLAGGDRGYWFYQGMVVLLISCPCALVISTPVSVVAALTAAARRGVLIKGGVFLEVAARLRMVAFDKTGVLTRGEPEVTGIHPLPGHTAGEILARVAGLEQRSEHPLAKAIVRHARETGVELAPVATVEALAGRGAQGELEGKPFWVGSGRLLAERHANAAQLIEQGLNGYRGTLVACGGGDEAYGFVTLQDSVRPEAAHVLQSLRSLGIERLVMLTGDNARAAEAVASALPLDAIHAGLLPDEKARAIEEARARHGVVAMVGDGINDTQAMAAASLGIALGAKGSDVALETADVVLMADDLRQLPFLLAHSRRALAVIQQNVAFALVTKAAFLALASLGLATLWMAIAADMGATLLVTFNGLRLLRPSRA